MNERDEAAEPERTALPPEADGLFREEAVREYLRGRTEGRILRISPSWVRWVFWVFFVTAVGAAFFVSTVRVDQYVSGPAAVRRVPAEDAGATRAGAPLEVVALLPASAHSLVTAGLPIRVHLQGAGDPSLDLSIDAVIPEIASPARIRALLGEDVAGIVALSGRAVIVRASLPQSSALPVPGSSGTAEVRVGRRTLLRALLPGGGS